MPSTIRTSLFAAALLLTLCVGSTAQTPAPQKQKEGRPAAAASEYKPLVERAKKGEEIDFVRLRDAYAAWDDEMGDKGDAPNRAAMVDAFNKGDLAKAVELAEVVLDYEFVNRGLHLAVEKAYRELGDNAKADLHGGLAAKLLKGLLATGDGKSTETAYRVLSIREEYLVMKELGIKVSMQSLLTKDDRSFDVLAGEDEKTGKQVEVYFDITRFFGGGGKNK